MDTSNPCLPFAPAPPDSSHELRGLWRRHRHGASTLGQAEIKSNDHITFQKMEENGDFTSLKIDLKKI